MQAIWDFIITHAKNFWAGFLAVLVAVLTFFGINTSNCSALPPVTTTTTAIVTTTVAPTKAPVTINSIGRSDTMAVFAGSAEEVTQLCKSTNAIGVATERTFTGVALKWFLEMSGVNLSEITAAATLVATAPHNDPARPDIVVTFSYAEFMDDTTLLAWYQVDGGNIDLDPMRIVLADALSGKFVTGPTSLTLNYNA